MESQPSPGPRGDPKQAITAQHVGRWRGGDTEEEASQHLRSPGRPPRGGDIIKMNGTGQAAVGRGEGELSWAGEGADAKARKCLQGAGTVPAAWYVLYKCEALSLWHS